MMKKIGCLLLVCACVVCVWAQDDTAARKKEINKVKKSDQYLYGEATMATQEEAVSLAEELLYDNINRWVAEQKKLSKANKVVVMNTKQLWGNIELPRGNMFRAFYYVKKADILPAENTNVIEKGERRPVGQGTKVEPLTAEELSVSPVVEQPKVDVQPIVTEQPVVAEQPLATEPVVTEPVKPVPEGQTPAVVPAAAPEIPQWPPVVNEVAAITDFNKLQACLNRLKAEGKVTDFNKYAALKDKNAYYLIVYNKEARIEAVLSTGPSRRNVKTGQADGVENYAGRGAIGFRINE
ncbi:MAG: hypothetical protein NC388_04775 [Clostridium sp.]|nr:hypothetical protein [Clostridium sp.]